MQNPQTNTLDAFLKLVDDPSSSDVKFVVSDDVLWAHKHILGVRSSYFEGMFRSDMKENNTGVITVNDVSVEAFEVILRHIYGALLIPTVPHQSRLAVEIFPYSHQYDLPDLFADCVEKIALTDASLPAMVVQANLYDCQILKDRCKKYMRSKTKKDMEKVVNTAEWADLIGKHAVVLSEFLISLTDAAVAAAASDAPARSARLDEPPAVKGRRKRFRSRVIRQWVDDEGDQE